MEDLGTDRQMIADKKEQPGQPTMNDIQASAGDKLEEKIGMERKANGVFRYHGYKDEND